MKKLLLSLLVMACAFATASAYDFMVNGLAYNINNDGESVSVTYEQKSHYQGWDAEQGVIYSPAYSNLSGELTVPTSVQHDGKTYSVTQIGQFAFEACVSLTSVAIPATIVDIAPYVFRYCDGLVAITVDAENPVYDSRDNCNVILYKDGLLKDQVVVACNGSVVPSSATSIGDYAFIGARTLNSVIIPEGVTSIGHNAFVECGMKSLTLPSTLTEIKQVAFANCSELKDVYAYFDPEHVTLEKNNVWQETLLNPEGEGNHAINLHVYPQYVQWYQDQPETSPWVWQGNRFNVMGDLGQELYIHGSYNNWTDVPFAKDENGKWTLSNIEMPASAEFKFVDQDNNWYGGTNENYLITKEEVVNGTALGFGDGDGTNFKIPVAGTWTFTVDLENRTLVISGEWNEPQPEPEQVFILGEVNDKSWAANDGVEMTTEDGMTFTADVTFDGRGNSGENYFSFSTKLAEDNDDGGWSYIAPYRFGAVSDGDYWFDDSQLGNSISLTSTNGQSIRIMEGDYTLTVNLEDMTLTITQQSSNYLVGDVNADGVVDVSDINILVNIILGSDNADNYDGRANVNGADDVDVSDINMVVNIMLGQNN